MNRELPAIAASAYASAVYDPTTINAMVMQNRHEQAANELLQHLNWEHQSASTPTASASLDWGTVDGAARASDMIHALRRMNNFPCVGVQPSTLIPTPPPLPMPTTQGTQTMAATSHRRIVQVFIADPDPNVPLDDSMLYQSHQKLTELDDQELFFEVPIKELLDQHNAKRAVIINKSIKDREVNLEPLRIRDLKMVVVTVAQF